MKATVVEGVAGLNVRAAALEALGHILDERKSIDDALDATPRFGRLDKRDGSFVVAILLTILRQKGALEAIVSSFLSRPLPAKSGLAFRILTIGAAQLLFMDVAPHAANDLCVRLAQADRGARHFTGLINAVLRRLATEGKERLAVLDAPRLNTPEWLWKRWGTWYGDTTARKIAAAHGNTPMLDLSVKDDPDGWAARLKGDCLVTGSVRLPQGIGPVEDLPGYGEGGWWVQDAAAALPARLLGDLRGKTLLDLCAAPGGKTMQLCAAGAAVTSVDGSAGRIGKLRENLDRTGLKASILVSDVLSLSLGKQFDCVLLDAPCSATGTIRRHPELPHIRSRIEIGRLAGLQQRLLSVAASYVRPGGKLVYCTCSLEPEEGELQIRSWLQTHPAFTVIPVGPNEAGIDAAMVTEDGFLRTLPFMKLGSAEGLDGFFAARLMKALSA